MTIFYRNNHTAIKNHLSSLYIWVNYNDLTILPHWNHGVYREIIPKWPNNSG